MDAGDFVLDALGVRWAVELCQQDYLSPGYFDGEAQANKRWQYYRTSTAGQNTILYNGTNQLVTAAPHTRFESSNSTVNHESITGLGDVDMSIWTANLTSAYDGPQLQRALKILNNRTQIMIQDQIKGAVHASQWRMHTRANIQISDSRKKAGKYLASLYRSITNKL